MARLAVAAVLVVVAAACTVDRPALDPDAPAVAGVPTPVPTPTPVPVPTSIPGPATPPAQVTATPRPPVPAPPTPTPIRPQVEAWGTFDVSLAPEVSGIVASRRDPDLLWLLDDGPGTTAIIAVRTTGELVTTVTMEGVEGRDTEGIAAGPCGAEDPTPCLYVGDIGDNNAVRERILVHRFPEPAADATSTPVTSASYTYPSGPVDAEALLVGSDGVPVIITKEPDTARVMAAAAFADGQLIDVGPLRIPPPPRPLLTLVTGLTVTGADSSPDGQRVLLRTYDHAVELTAPAAGAPLTTLARWTVVDVPTAAEGQGEAIAYLADGVSYVTASEGSGVLSVVRRE